MTLFILLPVPLAPLLIAGPVGLGVLPVIALIIGANRSARVAWLWCSAPLMWLGRGPVVVILYASSV